MKLRLERIAASHEATLSTLWIDGRFRCFSLEDEFRAVKVKGETRIPSGTYELGLHRRSKFQPSYRRRFGPQHVGMVHLLGVPGFRWVLIHCGNTDDHTDGCILVGDLPVENPVVSIGAIAKSRIAYKREILPVIEHLDLGKPASIEIIDRDRKAAA